jgi:hypothetical protein
MAARGDGLAGDLGDQGIAILEVAIRGGATDADRAGHFGERKTVGAAGRDHVERRFDQGLAQIAVVVGGAGGALRAEGHVRRGNMAAWSAVSGSLVSAARWFAVDSN